MTSFCEEERSQIRNKARAIEKLKREMYQIQFEKEMSQVAGARKTQVK